MKKIVAIVTVISFVLIPVGLTQELQSRPSLDSNSSRIEGLAPGESMPPLPQGPLILTNTSPEQLTPDYWINRLPNPDKALKTLEQLKLFNKEIHMMIREQVDIFQSGILPRGDQIRKQIELEYKTVSGRKLFDIKAAPIPKEFFETQVKPLVQWEQVPDKLVTRWGVATRATSVRALPTNTKMLEEIGDIEFDMIQYTLIKLWTPAAILHTSKDGRWYYVQAPYVRGWVKSKDIAIFKSRKALEEKAKSERFLVVTGESIPVCFDPECSEHYQRPSMGTILPIVQKNERNYVIAIPLRASNGNVLFKNYYVSARSDIHEGFPAFTQRNIIRQAFKLLGARYGWGGMYYGRDCSGFTHDVFLSMGVDMPRDSAQQALIGTQLGHFERYKNENEKIAAIGETTPGITLFKMPLHMMLYLGEVDGRFFIIHSTWAERVSMTSDEKNRINQVVVSDLSLNGRSYLGSLFDRIISINELD